MIRPLKKGFLIGFHVTRNQMGVATKTTQSSSTLLEISATKKTSQQQKETHTYNNQQ